MPIVGEIDPAYMVHRGGHAYAAPVGVGREARLLEASFDRDAPAVGNSPIAPLYLAFFQREPDPAGLQYWTERHAAGLPLEAIADTFAQSAEFNALYGELSNGDFLDRVYRLVLGRAPDANGRAHWMGELDHGATTRGRLVLAFARGPEFHAALVRHRVRVVLERATPARPVGRMAEVVEAGMGSYRVSDGEIVFSASDNSDPRANGRTYFVQQPFAMPPWWLVLVLLAGCVIALRRFGLPRAGAAIPWLYWAGFTAVALYLNALFALQLTAPVPTPDSYGYLIGSLFRTLGYPAFLASYAILFTGWQYLPLVQLNLILLGLATLSLALARVTRSYIAAWFLVALVLCAGGMLLQSVDILTEALFSALVMAHVAFLWLFFVDGRARTVAAAGASLAGAILVKSVALVLVGPLLLVLLFRSIGRRATLLLAVAPAVAAWLVPSAWNFARHGVFESSIAGGYALGGHVAWAIRERPGSAFPVEARVIERRLAPELAKRPADFGGLEAYVKYTSDEYNTLLWRNVVPALDEHNRAICPHDYFQKCLWSACTSTCQLRANAVLLGLSAEAIRAQPGQYAYHVLAHAQALWREVFAAASSPDLTLAIEARADELPEAYYPRANGYLAMLGPLPPFRGAVDRAATVAALEHWPIKRIVDAMTLHGLTPHMLAFATRIAPFTSMLGLLACAAVVRLGRRGPGFDALCHSALCLAAYFLGTALAQPVLSRYAWPMQGLMSAFLILVVIVVMKGLLRYRRGR